MYWRSLAHGIALSAHDVAAAPSHALMARQFTTASMLRFQCSQLVFDRIDPLVQPGIAPSTHMHQIIGGNAFNTTMTPLELDPSVAATAMCAQRSRHRPLMSRQSAVSIRLSRSLFGVTNGSQSFLEVLRAPTALEKVPTIS
ncbi:hypothetical protein EK21DRAFT_109224 [Setomelanomma holmii]|uniref:DUF1996 domain-containing protein n=1 Tax=Setomelanomma holmii TaxID=210430 RepID=A0A9P4HFH1_9PLEO|nr:hypothetical protein EK21DRAFT_109224 [Setomelanomma holmii]